jgi:hypothetical protein
MLFSKGKQYIPVESLSELLPLPFVVCCTSVKGFSGVLGRSAAGLSIGVN